MFSMKARVITKDYAEDGVVITNMARDICDGKQQIYDFCNHLMKNTWRLLRKMNFHGITSVRWKIRSAEKGRLLFTMEAHLCGLQKNSPSAHVPRNNRPPAAYTVTTDLPGAAYV